MRNDITRADEIIGVIAVLLASPLFYVINILVRHSSPLDAAVSTVGAVTFGVFMTQVLPARQIMQDRKLKHKAKRDSDRLALYRDWPPDLVDTFLAWEQLDHQAWNPHFFDDAPPGYVHWKHGDLGRPMSYAEHLANPQEYVRIRRR